MHPSMRCRGAAYVLVFLVTACGAPHDQMTPKNPSMRADIVAADIEPVRWRVSNAYDVVRILRPAMLLVDRVPTSVVSGGGGEVDAVPRIHVYVDDMPYGGVEMLSNIPVQSIVSIRRLSRLDATIHYGTGHGAGVIAVTTAAPRRW